MVASPTPPQHVLFETTDHDQAGEHLIRIYGTRPMGYLRRVRLDRAYQDLPAADRTSADVSRRSPVAGDWPPGPGSAPCTGGPTAARPTGT
jgi:hypothetical protein